MSGNFIVPVQLTPGFDASAYVTVVLLDPVIRTSEFAPVINAPVVQAEFTPLNWNGPMRCVVLGRPVMVSVSVPLE